MSGASTPWPRLAATRETFSSLPGISVDNWSAPQWSSDGARLFVSVHQAGENIMIVLSLQSLETTRVALPEHEGNFCWDLSVRPDGRRFAYVEGRGRTGGDSTLDDSGLGRSRRFRSPTGGPMCWSPTWSQRWTQGLLRLESRREHGPLAAGGGRRRQTRRGAARRHPGARHSFCGVFSRRQPPGVLAWGIGRQRVAGADSLGPAGDLGRCEAGDLGARVHRVRRPFARTVRRWPSARTGAATRTSGCCPPQVER